LAVPSCIDHHELESVPVRAIRDPGDTCEREDCVSWHNSDARVLTNTYIGLSKYCTGDRSWAWRTGAYDLAGILSKGWVLSLGFGKGCSRRD
jgi:hypothetical protein